MNNVAFSPTTEQRYSSGIGSVVIPDPKLMSREKYVVDCYKNSWVSIFIEGEGVRDRVHCDINTFNWIYFPEKNTELGTTVVWVFDPQKGNIYIVSCLAGGGNYEHENEHGFRLVRKLGSNFVEISGNSQKKSLNLVVHSDSGSTLDIGVTDKTKKSKLNVSVNGDITFRGNGTTQFVNHKKFGVLVENEKIELDQSTFEVFDKKVILETFRDYLNIWEEYNLVVSKKNEKLKNKVSSIKVVPEKITSKTKRFEINTGDEPMVKGDTLKGLLEELILEISKIQVVTPMGLMPIYNKAQILSFKLKTKKILSRYGFLN